MTCKRKRLKKLAQSIGVQRNDFNKMVSSGIGRKILKCQIACSVFERAMRSLGKEFRTATDVFGKLTVSSSDYKRAIEVNKLMED